MSTPVYAADILIVDDTPMNQRLLSHVLTQNGYKTRIAGTGKQALEAVRQAHPDLVLLDIMMPEMTGYDVCEQLKADPATHSIPVVFLSALDATEDKVRAFTVGGVDYITKPFQIEEVLARVETHLSLQALRRQLQVTNKDLEQKLDELQARNAELDAFAHTVAHDLKNPLSTVLGFAHILAQRPEMFDTKEDMAREAGRVLSGAQKMYDIIESLLLLAGVRKEVVDLSPLDMSRIVHEVQERLGALIQEYHPQIILPAAWPTAYGYAPWIEEVWANYISNAMKYGGQPPRLELGAEASNGLNGKAMVRFWVRDNGPGLSPEQQAKLFTPFTRIHVTRAKGHGLGLSIVQRIVEKFGGEVGVVSQPGEGSTFYFTLPAEAET
ncbi:MAG TPA: hybrid sensor histidine kinase/response regulator [Anaerolineales bacterium]|nr:hybrid sensor histidine kinase/response regulator [Anaerolineales bacterium]